MENLDPHKKLVEDVRAAVADRLEALGWKKGAWTAVASKSYDTAVGAKEAVVYLASWGPSEANVTLTGAYQSEGHNILSTCFVSVPKTAGREEIDQKVGLFVEQAEKAISESYARRLLLEHGFRAPRCDAWRAAQDEAEQDEAESVSAPTM